MNANLSTTRLYWRKHDRNGVVLATIRFVANIDTRKNTLMAIPLRKYFAYKYAYGRWDFFCSPTALSSIMSKNVFTSLSFPGVKKAIEYKEWILKVALAHIPITI